MYSSDPSFVHMYTEIIVLYDTTTPAPLPPVVTAAVGDVVGQGEGDRRDGGGGAGDESCTAGLRPVGEGARAGGRGAGGRGTAVPRAPLVPGVAERVLARAAADEVVCVCVCVCVRVRVRVCVTYMNTCINIYINPNHCASTTNPNSIAVTWSKYIPSETADPHW